MKVTIKNVEKIQGIFFAKKLYGVATHVIFTEEEKAIIDQRGIGELFLMERDIPADVDPEKFNNRGITKKLATAIVKGSGSGHFHLTASKLMRDTDTYYMFDEHHRNVYHEDIRKALQTLKELIESTATVVEDDSFEL